MQALITKQLQGIVHLVDRKFVVLSRGRKLFLSEDDGEKWDLLAVVPGPMHMKIRCATKLSRRLFRSGIHHILRSSHNELVIFADRYIYNFNVQSKQFNEKRHTIAGSRPLNVCVSKEGHIYYGEYLFNPERRPVHIYRSTDAGKSWETACVLEDVRHVHGVFYDRYDDALWVTTGDTDRECIVWKTRDGFKTLDKVISGEQLFRAVQLLFSREHVYFGSDSPLQQNYICRLERKTLEVNKLQPVDGPIFYGATNNAFISFATVCEPLARSQNRSADLWITNTGEVWSKLLSFEKDRWPMRLCQYGQIKFPSGNCVENVFWCSLLATVQDQTTLRLQIR